MPTYDNSPSTSANTRMQVSEMRARDARGRRTMTTLHTALVALIDERPFERITVDDIVANAGVSRSTFYRHYEHKEALLEELARKEIAYFVDLALPILDKRDSLPMCRRVVAYVDEHRKLWSVLLTGGAAGVMRQKFVELTTPAFSELGNTQEDRLPVDLTAEWGVAATVAILAWWLKHPKRATAEQVAGFLDRLAVRPSLDRS